MHMSKTLFQVTANLLVFQFRRTRRFVDSLKPNIATVIPQHDDGWRHNNLQTSSRSNSVFLRQINPTIPHTPAVYSFEQESCASSVNLNRDLLFVISRFGVIHL